MALARPNPEVHRSRGVIVRPVRGGWERMNFIIKTERDEEGWFIATVPELPSCYTQARTEKQLYKRIWEAIELALKDSLHG